MNKIFEYEHLKYPERTICTIQDLRTSHCFDFLYEEIDELIDTLKKLKESKPLDVSKEDWYIEGRLADEEYEKKHSKWYMKLYENYLEDVGIQFTPFDWKFSIRSNLMFRIVSGINLGPFTITFNRVKSKEDKNEF